MNTDTDPAHDALIIYQRYIRKELILWFFTSIISVIIFLYTLVQWNSITSEDLARGYIAVDDNGQQLKTTPVDEPHPVMKSDDILDWLNESLVDCMTFDSFSYEVKKAHCSANVFSTNRSYNDNYNLGQQFYAALEKADVISILKANRTSMTIEIVDAEFKEEKVQRYPTRTKSGRQPAYYTYFYQLEFKILMHGQNLDAPIVYDVRVERMSETNRRNGLGIRSVISR